MLQKQAEYGKEYFVSKIHGNFPLKFLLLRYQTSLLVTGRQLWWMNRE
jgi:hypothetical protein